MSRVVAANEATKTPMRARENPLLKPSAARKLLAPTTNALTLAPRPLELPQSAYLVFQASTPVRNVPSAEVNPRPSPATQARMTRTARKPSVSMEPKPTNLASVSHLSCLDDVPEETRQWKPETAPQAMVTNRKGKIRGKFLAVTFSSMAGATISSGGRMPSGVSGLPPKSPA